MDNQSPLLVCLGNFTIDDVYLPDGSMTPDCMGGDALFAALGARIWNPSVQIIAPIGSDIPKDTLETMRTTGFDLGVLPERNLPTIHNRVYYDKEGGRHWEILSTPEQFDLLSPRPKDIPENYLHAKAFLISAMSLEAQEELVLWLNKHTKSVIALDTQEDYVVGNERRLKSMISGVEIFLPSEAEVKMMLGHQDWPVAAQELAAMGPRIVVIKRGENGVLVYDRENDIYFKQSPIPGRVVDTTGAGDAFCGGFMASYLHNPNDLPQAARSGSISALFAISSFGMTTLLESKSADGLRLVKEIENT